jgi:uncharacterized coiled-coil protein SlyX
MCSSKNLQRLGCRWTNKRLTMFKDNNEVKKRLLDLELKIEHQQRDLSELKTLMVQLSLMVNNLQTQMNNLLDKQQKSL